MGVNSLKFKWSYFFILILGLIGWLAYNPILRIFYPLQYEDYIVQSAKQFHLDPTLLAAVIKVESNYEPEAISDAGAQGLMQLMPSTADWAALQLNLSGYSRGDIREPKVNIELGSWYLNYLLDEYHADEGKALAAYNGGSAHSDSPESRAYVVRVLDARRMYKKLYPELR